MKPTTSKFVAIYLKSKFNEWTERANHCNLPCVISNTGRITPEFKEGIERLEQMISDESDYKTEQTIYDNNLLISSFSSNNYGDNYRYR